MGRWFGGGDDPSEPSGVRVNIRVREEGGGNISVDGAKVTIGVRGVRKTLITDSTGWVHFEDVDTGPRHVWVEADGFKDLDGHFEVVEPETHLTVVLVESGFSGEIIDPLRGKLRKMGRSYRDNTGPRGVYFCSWFPALRILRDDRDAFYRELDNIHKWGWLGVRVFWAVGRQPYWRGREVAPVTFTHNGITVKAWRDYDKLFREMILAFRERKLRFHLTAGDLGQIFAGKASLELRQYQRIAELIQGENAAALVGLFEAANEPWQNTREGLRFDERAQTIFAALRPLLPGVQMAIGATPRNEELLEEWARGANVSVVHGTRQPWDMALRRAFNLMYEGQRHVNKPIWQGEPTGPGPEVFQPTGDKHILWALYALHLITGQASVYFNSPAVRYRAPLGSEWGFKELPALYKEHIPKGIGQWGTIIHGNRHDSPMSAKSFASAGAPEGPDRVDMVSNGSQILTVVSAGRGPWKVYPRRNMRYQVINANGVEREGRVSSGQEIPGLHAGLKARVIRGWFE